MSPPFGKLLVIGATHHIRISPNIILYKRTRPANTERLFQKEPQENDSLYVCQENIIAMIGQ
jgi:hypothetical protein